MALFMKDKRSTQLLYNTMSSVVAGMTGMCTIIDLRNEASVRGTITSVDGYMNVEMEDCVFRNPRGEFCPFSNFFIAARNIRYVHIPDKCDPLELINIQQNMNKRVKNVSKKRTFKQKRAQNYHSETVANIQ